MVMSLLVARGGGGGKESAYFWGNLKLQWTFETHLRKVVSKQPGVRVSCAEWESYLIVHVCSRAISMQMFCLAWSIVSRVVVVGGVSFGCEYCSQFGKVV